MHAETDLLQRVRHRLWLAVLRRRAPVWLLALLPLLALVPWRPALLAGLLAWALWMAFDLVSWRRRIVASWSAWLDAAVPALEDSSALLAADSITALGRLQQQRLQARLLSVLDDDDYRRIAGQRAPFTVLPLVAALLASGAAWGWQLAATGGVAPHTSAAASVPAAAEAQLVLRVVPPAYSGVKPFDSGVRELQVPEYSQVSWCLKAAGQFAPLIELSDGQVLKVGEKCAEWRATESLFWRWRSAAGGSASARFNLRVTPDKAPQISIESPREMVQTLNADAKGVLLAVAVRDDYAVVRASLHLTLARGSGENVRFTDREMPLPKSSDPRQRNWSKQWTLAELGMEPGDDLYFFVRASDNAPDHPHTTQSPTYTLRLPGPVEEGLDSSATPTLVKPENLRSQRQIIIDTEQLLADMKATKMSAATLRARSEDIAADQAQLRLRYGQFLGEESSLFGDEHQHGGAAKEEHHKEEHHDKDGHEHEKEPAHAAPKPGSAQDMIAEFGHAHDQEDNATIFDPATKEVLRRALVAMWAAEKALRAITPNAALAPEHKALEAIKELQQADRIYLHRTAFVPPALKEESRLSGDAVGALSYKRKQGDPVETVPAGLRELIQALASDAALPALWSKQAQELIAARIPLDEQKLAAQRAVQDVADGCADCRAVLRAWLRGAITEPPLLLQAQPAVETGFGRALRGGEQP